MLSVRNDFPNYQFVNCWCAKFDKDFYEQFVDADVHFVSNRTYDLFKWMFQKATLVTSGTATLETALLNIPKRFAINLAEFLMKSGKGLSRISNIFRLFNLIMDKEVVT